MSNTLISFTNLPIWLESIRKDLQPPVGNKLLWGLGHHKVMLVGGPNARRDYHIERGEELFFQLEGDMVLEVMEKGLQRNIPIRQGEIFRLPADIPHSPQRKENTVGLVLERERIPGEIDALRWYTPDGTGRILYEEIFFCTDLGQQLKPVIQRFNASEACHTGEPTLGAPESVQHEGVIVNSTLVLESPINLYEWVQLHAKGKTNGSILYDSNDGFEYTVLVITETLETEWIESLEHGEIFIYLLNGIGEMDVFETNILKKKNEGKDGEGEGERSEINTRALTSGDVVLIPAEGQYKIRFRNIIGENATCLVVKNKKGVVASSTTKIQ